MSIEFFMFLIAVCSASVEFSSRERNLGLYLIYENEKKLNYGNIIIAPLGIWSLISAVFFGATGKCREQFSNVLISPHHDVEFVDGYTNLTETVLSSGNKLIVKSQHFVFIDSGIYVKPEFRSVLQTSFRAAVKVIDFRDTLNAARIANAYMLHILFGEKNVMPYIREAPLRSDDFQETTMIMSNVVMFRGNWLKPFNKSNTYQKRMYNDNKEVVGQMNMMELKTSLFYSNYDDMDATILELPYKENEKYCMLLITPYVGVSIAEVYKKFNSITFRDIFDKLQSDVDTFGLKDVVVELPRFTIQTELILDEVINNMGINNAFDPKLATFDKIANESIYMSTFEHNAYIEFTETGTVAYATTPGNLKDKTNISQAALNIDKPFIFFILEKPTLTLIFGGAYTQASLY